MGVYETIRIRHHVLISGIFLHLLLTVILKQYAEVILCLPALAEHTLPPLRWFPGAIWKSPSRARSRRLAGNRKGCFREEKNGNYGGRQLDR